MTAIRGTLVAFLAAAALSAAAQERVSRPLVLSLSKDDGHGAVRKDGDTLEFLDAPPPQQPGEKTAPPAPNLPFDADTVRQTVEAHQAEVGACYEAILAEGARPHGEVRVRFTVGKNGAVTHAEVQRSTLQQPRVERCILQAVRRWPFPHPARPKTIVFPFRLSVDRAAASEQVFDPPKDEDEPQSAPPPTENPR